MKKVYIAFGGNIGNVEERIQTAITMLCSDDKNSANLELISHSTFWFTEPVGTDEEQDWYTNSVAVFHCPIEPHKLLEKTKEVEYLLGRVRVEGNQYAARTIDIDILDYEDFHCSDAELTLPHPRMFERAFVLIPLREIEPNYVFAGKSIDDFLSFIDYKVYRKSIFQKF